MDLWVENTADTEHRIKACGFPLAGSPYCPLAPPYLQAQNTPRRVGCWASPLSQPAPLPDNQPHPQACSSRPRGEEGARRANRQQGQQSGRLLTVIS